MLEPIKELTCEIYGNNNNNQNVASSNEDMLSDSRNGSINKEYAIYNNNREKAKSFN